VGNTEKGKIMAKKITVHPHACGEHVYNGPRSHDLTGSSPRLWGTLGQALKRCFLLRFIPTPVGNTDLVGPRSGYSPVHPHACGEHIAKKAETPPVTGSSPRLWGTLLAKIKELEAQRFIPTPVGNT